MMIKKYLAKITPYLSVKDNKITEKKKSVANKLTETFSENSSSNHYCKKFQILIKDKGKYKMNLKTKNQEEYNHTFSITELKDSIEK